GHRDRLVVRQEQRWHGAARFEPVSPGGAGRRLDAVAEFPEPVDVAPDRALRDAQTARQLRARPVPVRLQQIQQGEGPRGGVGHVTETARDRGPDLSAFVSTLPAWLT